MTSPTLVGTLGYFLRGFPCAFPVLAAELRELGCSYTKCKPRVHHHNPLKAEPLLMIVLQEKRSPSASRRLASAQSQRKG